MLEIGQQIKKLREEKRITGKDLAQRIGLSQSQMSRLEQGQRRIDTEILARIADALGVPAASFFSVGEVDDDPLTTKREKELELSRVHQEIGRRIRHERRQRHLTVEDLARRTGLPKAYALAVEEGRRDGLEGDFLKKACKILAIDLFDVIQAQEGIIRSLKTRVHRLDRRLAAGEGGARSEDEERLLKTPILVGDESVYPQEFDDRGLPVAAVEGFLLLPDLAGRATFALRVVGLEMFGAGEAGFVEGELIVFATDRSAQSGEYSFVRDVENRTYFRQLFQDDAGTVRLQALAPEVPPILLAAEQVVSAWPLVSRIRAAG